MEALDGALTTLFGSQRSGLDIATVLIALAMAFVAVRQSNQIVQLLVDCVTARIRLMEERNEACVLLAATLAEIQDGVAANRAGIDDNRDQMKSLRQRLDRMLSEKEAEDGPSSNAQ